MHDGMTVPPWSGRGVTDANRSVKRRAQATDEPCSICKQPIDFTLTYPHPDSCSVQHVKPQSLFPHLRWDPSNWVPAHLQCNKSAGTSDSLGLGVIGSDW